MTADRDLLGADVNWVACHQKWLGEGTSRCIAAILEMQQSTGQNMSRSRFRRFEWLNNFWQIFYIFFSQRKVHERPYIEFLHTKLFLACHGIFLMRQARGQLLAQEILDPWLALSLWRTCTRCQSTAWSDWFVEETWAGCGGVLCCVVLVGSSISFDHQAVINQEMVRRKHSEKLSQR